MTPEERDILQEIQRKLDDILDNLKSDVDRHDAILCSPNGIVDAVKRNTITLYGDDTKVGLVEKARMNRVIATGSLFGVCIYAVTHIADVVTSLGKWLHII
jgi:hypothetical protein